MDTAPQPRQTAKPGFDIFCRVIDNYGDIGVCWRLARQLAARLRAAQSGSVSSAAEGNLVAPLTQAAPRIRLWVDDLASFARIEPAIDPQTATPQTAQGVEVYHWEQAEDEAVRPLQAVVETFACELPPAYRARLRPGAQHWVNLEYLSAETWVEDCHGLPSPQANGVAKSFFFPGFTVRTGGLLREPELLPARDAWLRDPANRAGLLQSLGLPDAWSRGLLEQGWRQCYAFCYAHAPLQALVDACQAQPQPTVLLAAPGAPATKQDGERVMRVDCPFVDQHGFDRLLWSSDLNVVRGEDSFVRAIWAARPFLWHIYPQQDEVHMDKLQAWFALAPCPPEAAELMQAWNRNDAGKVEASLAALLAPAPWRAWRGQAARFSAQQAEHADLAGQLLRFIQAR